MAAGQVWTADDIRFLRDNYGKISNWDIADALGRSAGAVSGKVTELGLAPVRDGSADRHKVRDMWGKHHPEAISKAVGIALCTVYAYAKGMHLGPSGFGHETGHALGTAAANAIRATMPDPPKGITAEQIAWARENFHHPEHWREARAIAAMLL